MNSHLPRILLPATIALGCVLAVYAAIFRPGYFSNSDELAMVLFLQVVLAAMWNYRARFFPLLMVVFLWAGMILPMSATWTSGRWFVLAAGAFAGLVVFTRDRKPAYGWFHWMAFLCVLAALISAAQSAYTTLALLKAMSLLLLFLYGSSGARLAVTNKPEQFFAGLSLACELIVYLSAVTYFIFKLAIFGNPNSLGAVMGVAAVPILLWGILTGGDTLARRRRIFAFALALLLLFSSYARAGIAAAVVSCILLCVALRRYALLVKGMALALALAAFVMAALPLHDESSNSMTAIFLYKGRRDDGILASRKTVWDDTVSAIQEHPWFGSGFGISPTGSEVTPQIASFESLRQATREHGNSYLAITEWVGFVGGIPFFALALMVAVNVGRVFQKVRRDGQITSIAIPLAGVLAAGLVHAAFEDWLFAPGYYLCVFFWSLAFIMVDVLPDAVPAPAFGSSRDAQPWINTFGAVAPGR